MTERTCIKNEYRTREALVEVSNGFTSRTQRRFIAERKNLFLFFQIWVPVLNGGWRVSEEKARSDIAYDIELMEPIAEPKPYVDDTT